MNDIYGEINGFPFDEAEFHGVLNESVITKHGHFKYELRSMGGDIIHATLIDCKTGEDANLCDIVFLQADWKNSISPAPELPSECPAAFHIDGN